MAKDPAFLFFPGDWLGGTMTMTYEEKGIYISLLMLQFNNGHMTLHMMAHYIGHMFNQFWDKYSCKFITDEQGLYFNVKLDEEKKRRKAYTDSRSKNKEGKNQFTKNKKKSGHMTSHMENGNRNGDYNDTADENFEKFEKLLIIPQMCALWYSSFSTYTQDKDNDFDGMGKVLQFMNRQTKIQISDPNCQIKILNTLQLIVDQVNREPFWINKPIKSIANNIQEFYNNIKNPQNGKRNTKAESGTLRERVQAEFNKRYSNGK